MIASGECPVTMLVDETSLSRVNFFPRGFFKVTFKDGSLFEFGQSEGIGAIQKGIGWFCIDEPSEDGLIVEMCDQVFLLKNGAEKLQHVVYRLTNGCKLTEMYVFCKNILSPELLVQVCQIDLYCPIFVEDPKLRLPSLLPKEREKYAPYKGLWKFSFH